MSYLHKTIQGKTSLLPLGRIEPWNGTGQSPAVHLSVKPHAGAAEDQPAKSPLLFTAHCASAFRQQHSPGKLLFLQCFWL